MLNMIREVRFNEFYRKEENGEYKRFVEVIFLLDKAEYSLNNEGEIIRQRALDKISFVSGENNLINIGELLIQVGKNKKEKEVTNA
jgi:hypothetical protein